MGRAALILAASGGAGGLDRLEGDIVSVVAHGGHSGDGVVAAVVALGAGVVVDVILDALIELRGTALLIEGGDIQLDVRALRGCEHLVVIERIGADEGDVDAEGAGLLDDLGGVGDGDGGEDDVRAGGLGLIQIGGEVGVVRGEGVGDDGAARGLKDLGEVADQALIVLVAVLAEAVSGLGRELVLGEVREDGGLEVIQEADAEVVVVAGGDVGGSCMSRRWRRCRPHRTWGRRPWLRRSRKCRGRGKRPWTRGRKRRKAPYRWKSRCRTEPARPCTSRRWSSTVGVSELAYCMPSTSFLPPEAESPDRGSNTPILMTLSPLLVLLWPPSPPQATSDKDHQHGQQQGYKLFHANFLLNSRKIPGGRSLRARPVMQ